MEQLLALNFDCLETQHYALLSSDRVLAMVLKNIQETVPRFHSPRVVFYDDVSLSFDLDEPEIGNYFLTVECYN